MTDDLTARREADALDLWRAKGKVPVGVCPHCGSVVSVVQRDERFRARCSHRGCGASGPQHVRLTSAVEAFCRPPAYVVRHMGVHPSSLTDVVTTLEAERDAARAELADERAKLLAIAAAFNGWANGGASGGAAIDGMETVGSALGEPWEDASDQSQAQACACSTQYREMAPGIHAQYCTLAGQPLDDGRQRWRCTACDAVSTVDRCPQCGGASVQEGRS